MNAYPDDDVSFLIIWEPMLPSDNEAAAQQASEMFTDRRVVQYWDPDRASGLAYSRDVFPDAWRELLLHLPEDSPIRPHIERGADAEPTRRPMWDFAAFYPAGVRWADAPPAPESFIRQLAMFKNEDGSTQALLVTDSFAKPPIESDWFDLVRVKSASLLGRAVPDVTRTGALSGDSLPACCATPLASPASAPTTSPLVSLAENTDPFRERFNSSSDRPRFVAILSSTCGPCVSGAVTVNEAVVGGFRDAGIDVSVVWIDVLPSDGATSAARASSIFTDSRVTQYHDPNQLLGDAFAEGLLSRGPAWDIYLFYPAGGRWEDGPPAPMDWMHQLGGGVAEQSRYKTEVRLAAAMHETMTSLGFETDATAPTGEQLAAARSAATVRIGQTACATATTIEGQCERCAASGLIGQCSISGWRYVVASMVRNDAGMPTNRFEMTGAPQGPVAQGEIDAADRRREYSIEGMTCPDCTTAVAGKALQARGVTRVEVDYDAKRLIVFTNDDPESELEMLPMHLGLAGYQITPIK